MARAASQLCVIPLPFQHEIRPGDSLLEKLLLAARQHRVSLSPGDILVIKHKIISKAEGQIVDLAKVTPKSESAAWARRYHLDPRVIELALAQSRRVVRRKRGVLITETRHGFICANSGIDVSNVTGGHHAVLLPEDADRSAQSLYRQLKRRLKFAIPVIITDSFGRPWREGLTEVAIGVAGMRPLLDCRGQTDPHGYQLHASLEAIADELASAAGLVCGKLARTPACIIRGFRYQSGPGTARELIRPARNDLFR